MKKSIGFYSSALIGMLVLLIALPSQAGLVYWNLFNVEGESSLNSNFVTYSTLNDMLNDANRISVTAPGGGFGKNIVGSGSDGNAFWNLFNIEGESSLNSNFVTYNTLDDMLHDTNRTSVTAPGGGFGKNIVGSGSDGNSYWNLFNIEGESSLNSNFVTYSTLNDMLHDVNRTSVTAPGGGFGKNIVGSGSDGNSYWNLFNIEGESSLNSNFVTYNTLDDMLNDANRTSVTAPGGGFGKNIVGSGALIIADTPPTQPIPEPPAVLLFFLGLSYLFQQKQTKH